LEAFTVKFRIAIAAALAIGVALGTTGCNLIQPQATTKHYDASDGVGVNVGALKLRNLIVLSNDGITGSLLLTGVNTTGLPLTLTITYASGSTKQVVPSSDLRGKTWGGHDEPQIILNNISTEPGAMIELSFTDGTETVATLIPVLTTQQPEYTGLEPRPELCSSASGCEASPVGQN
jgi:hypothetical protein